MFSDLRGMSIVVMGPSHPVTLHLGLFSWHLSENIGGEAENFNDVKGDFTLFRCA
jgi:hypothetical protein